MPPLRMVAPLIAVAISLLPSVCLSQAQPRVTPEISHVFPDFPCGTPRIVTGESFDLEKTEVWTWSGPPLAEKIEDAIAAIPLAEVALPAEPPKDARQSQVLDVERQILVANIDGAVAWVKTPGGVSKPILINVARPCWLSAAAASPGDKLHIFGFGLRALYRPMRVVLKGDAVSRLVPDSPPSRDYRSTDASLVFFDIPHDLPAGGYRVFIHNGNGGALGWRQAGKVDVAPAAAVKEKLFKVTDYGAKGDDEDDDFPAIARAVAAAKEALAEKVRPVVYFPAGKWRTDTTIEVPGGVTLRGAGRDLAVIEGFGTPPADKRTTAIVRPLNHTVVESVSIRGATYKGPGDYWEAPVATPPQGKEQLVEDITIRGCRISGGDEHQSAGRFHYRLALGIPSGRYVRILDNDIHGAMSAGGYRTEVIGNVIHGGGMADNVSFVAGSVEALIDSNRIVDAGSRFMVWPVRNCSVRFNEVLSAHRGLWENCEEVFLVHGGAQKQIGKATSAGPATLADAGKKWKPGSLKDNTVLIVGGRGFGQYRTIADNTADTLTIDRPWRVQPDATSQYVAGAFFTDNSWFANLNQTPGRMSLWLDCIGNVVERHRDSHGGGLDLWGSDETDRRATSQPAKGMLGGGCYPSWYNVVRNCWFDSSRALLWSAALGENDLAGSPLFGNIFEENKFRQSHASRTGFDMVPAIDAALAVGNRSGADMTKPQDARAAVSHTLVVGNVVSDTPRGISVSDTARKTFLLRNEFTSVDKPVLDWGLRTRLWGNVKHTLDEKGQQRTPIPDSAGTRDLRSTSQPR